MLPAAATEFYALQQRVNVTTRNEVKRIWARMGGDFDAGWRRHGPAALAVLVEAQRVVSNEAANYVPELLSQVDLPNTPMGTFQPESLVGQASDGRPLDTLAYSAVVEAKTAVAAGATEAQALATGGSWLDLMTALQIAVVARQATSVQVATQRRISNYVRVLNPPSCQRCAILAGRVYKWSTGFDRHPRCDCQMMPAANAEWAKSEGFITDPMDAYRQGQIKTKDRHGNLRDDLTLAQRNAIDDGANIGQVVNAYRGVSTTATRTRTIVKRAPKSVVDPGAPDLLGFLNPETRFRSTKVPQNLPTPEGIYQDAKGDREAAVRMLREFGYIT